MRFLMKDKLCVWSTVTFMKAIHRVPHKKVMKVNSINTGENIVKWIKEFFL